MDLTTYMKLYRTKQRLNTNYYSRNSTKSFANLAELYCDGKILAPESYQFYFRHISLPDGLV